ncbi:hypothetical protein STRMOE7_20490 [Streptomyces sp. MOE7]|nr:hypothetical protein STRMOE7_20490 [Streptomyces sp. MOE7]
MILGEEAQGDEAVGAVLGVEVEADEVVRGPSAGDAVAGRPGGGGEQPADREGVGARVVHAVSGAPAAAATGRDLGVAAVRGADGGEFAAGQRDDRVAVLGGAQGVVERRGVRVGVRGAVRVGGGLGRTGGGWFGGVGGRIGTAGGGWFRGGGGRPGPAGCGWFGMASVHGHGSIFVRMFDEGKRGRAEGGPCAGCAGQRGVSP